jgi:hypothetical protein
VRPVVTGVNEAALITPMLMATVAWKYLPGCLGADSKRLENNLPLVTAQEDPLSSIFIPGANGHRA